jgi:diguanylate cyclase (GGDEF)-like protein
MHDLQNPLHPRPSPLVTKRLLALLLAFCAPALAAQDQAPPPVELDGTWLWHAGDSLAWANPAHPEVGWSSAQVPGEWELQHPDYDGFAWYRRSVVLPEALMHGPLGIWLPTVGDAFEVYWNGVKVGGEGSLPPNFVEGIGPGLFLVPEAAMAQTRGGEHVITVRVYNEYLYGGLMGGLRIGRYDVLAQRRSPRDMVIGGLVSFFLAIGVYHLAFFIRRRAARENLYFAVLCLAVSLYGATFSEAVSAALIPYINPVRLDLLALALGAPAFVVLIHRLFDLPTRRRDVITTGAFIVAAVIAAALPLPRLAAAYPWLDGVLVAGSFLVVIRAARATSRHRPHASTLVVGTTVFAMALAYDAAGEYSWVPIAQVLPGVNSLFWIGFLVFVVAVGMATAGKWAVTEVTALVDPLTDLSRRHVLEDALRRETERLRRTGGEVALVMIDLDYFKSINDAYGHRIGDLVLARVGRLLRSCARNIDLPARFGGEEFAVLLADSSVEGAAAFAERFRGHLEEVRVPVPGGGTVGVTASVGVAAGSELVDPDELIQTADQALYQAKGEGRNRMICLQLGAPGDPPRIVAMAR